MDCFSKSEKTTFLTTKEEVSVKPKNIKGQKGSRHSVTKTSEDGQVNMKARPYSFCVTSYELLYELFQYKKLQINESTWFILTVIFDLFSDLFGI